MLKHIGRSQPVPVGLVKSGPLMNVRLSYHPAAEPALPQAPVPARMMIDTGAERTLVEKRIAEQLGLAPIRFDDIIGVSQKAEPHPVYLMSVSFTVADERRKAGVMFAAEIVGMKSPPTPQPHVGLLGRDFLMRMRFNYDGPQGCFELIPDRSVVAPALPPPHPPAAVHDVSKSKHKRKLARKSRKRNRGR